MPGLAELLGKGMNLSEIRHRRIFSNLTPHARELDLKLDLAHITNQSYAQFRRGHEEQKQ